MAFAQSVAVLRLRSPEGLQVSTFPRGTRRFFHPKLGVHIIKIFAGDCYVTARDDELLATILGSCISACIRDPIAKIGGMNHFLLPGNSGASKLVGEAARYGVYAMEMLINSLMGAGARKDRLEIKLVGGGNVLQNTACIGTLNSQFIREYLSNEGLRITGEDLEGTRPRSVHYSPLCGKVTIRYLRRHDDLVVVEEESRYLRTIYKKPIEGDIELF